MGRASADEDRLIGELFPEEEVRSARPPDTRTLSGPADMFGRGLIPPSQTDAKARLVSGYLARFQMVTKSGVYIDGFAAPQKLNRENAWCARRVLELQPKWIRTAFLCDIDPAGIERLRDLRRLHHRRPQHRRVFVHGGDFNVEVENIIARGSIRKKTPTFVLLDQRKDECRWSTVQRLASLKAAKVEMLYFVGTGWMMRTMKSARKPERFARLDAWWGDGSWREHLSGSQDIFAHTMAARFADELGYRNVMAWPIYRGEGRRLMFHLIHASDHPRAMPLMRDAYKEEIGAREGTAADEQTALFGSD